MRDLAVFNRLYFGGMFGRNAVRFFNVDTIWLMLNICKEYLVFFRISQQCNDALFSTSTVVEEIFQYTIVGTLKNHRGDLAEFFTERSEVEKPKC